MQSLGRTVHYRNADPPPEIVCRSDRKTTNKLTKRQILVVEERLSKKEKTFDEVLDAHHVTIERWVNWMLEPAFRRYLKRVRKGLHEQAKLMMAIAAKKGAHFLMVIGASGASDPKHDKNRTSQARAAETILKLALLIERHDAIEVAKPDRPLERQLAHPAHSQEEILRLLDVCEGKAPSD